MKSICLLILTLGLTSLLISCNTVSKEECEGADWHGLGFKGAVQGERLRGSLPDRYRRCEEKHNVRPDFEAVKTGYSEGLKYFCTQDSGMTFGREGGSYRFTCPKDAEKTFLDGYRTGKLDYVSDRVESLEDEVRRLRHDVSDRDDHIRALESQLRSKN